MINAWVDGSVVGGHWGSKKGPKTIPKNYIGWVVRDAESKFIAHHSFYMGESETFTGNTAEEFAVSSVLRWLIRNGYTEHAVVIHSDSQLTVGHISGQYAVNNEVLKKYVAANNSLIALFPSVRMKWIRREENKYADAASKFLQPKFAEVFGEKIPEQELTPEFLEKWK
jgi:ribonuclease HI